MSLWLWILSFFAYSAFSYWVVFRDGADYLEGWKSFFLVHTLAPRWSAEGIKLFVFLSWPVSALAFLVGLFKPGLRSWSFF